MNMRKLMSLLMMCLLMNSCVTTIEPELSIDTKADTTEVRKPPKPMPPTPPIDTTDREPIGWNPSVEDWEEIDI